MIPSDYNSTKVLKLATDLCFVVIAASQLLFITYITKFYGGSAFSNNTESWSEMSIKGYVEGDSIGNFVFATHLILAVVITISGLIQLVPWIRENWLRIHKYSGRIYIYTATILSLGGLYLVWIREAILSINGAIAISLNALLIFLFSFMTIIKARSGQIKSHRKWALRTFIVVSGVWFFRIGFMAWIMIHQEAKWSTENLDGPFDLVWSYANYLLPLTILEMYFYLSEKQEKSKDYILSVILILCLMVICIGTVGSYMIMWGPNM